MHVNPLPQLHSSCGTRQTKRKHLPYSQTKEITWHSLNGKKQAKSPRLQLGY